MKVLHEKDYQYLGKVQTWHAFKCLKTDFDPEILLLYRARMICNDGSSKFFDPVGSTVDYLVKNDQFGNLAVEVNSMGKKLGVYDI